MTVSLDHEALKVYQEWPKGSKSAMVCSALVLHNVHTKKNRNDAAREKLRDRKMYRLEKEVKVANYRLECIQRGDSDPGDGPAVYLEYLAATEGLPRKNEISPAAVGHSIQPFLEEGDSDD